MRRRPAGSPPPTPGVEQAHMHLPDLRNAVSRIEEAWNPAQLRDAMRSAKAFLDQMDRAIASFEVKRK